MTPYLRMCRVGDGWYGGALQEVYREGQVRHQDPGPQADAQRGPRGEPAQKPAGGEGPGHRRAREGEREVKGTGICEDDVGTYCINELIVR